MCIVISQWVALDKYLYILPAVIALFWVLRIFFLKNLSKVQLLIAAGMVMAIITMFYREFFVLFVFPMYHLAVRQNTSPKGITKWDWLTLLPSFLFIPYTGTIYFKIYLIVQIAAITVWSIISVRKYNKRLAELYDTSSEASSDDISQVLLYMIITVVVFLVWLMLPDSAATTIWIALPFAIFLAVLQFFIGYHAYNLKDTSSIAAEFDEIEVDAVKPADPTAQDESGDDALIKGVLERELYLDPAASLVSMAELLGTNRTYLSNSIHACRNQNFSEFINTLRVNYFMELVKKDPDINVKEAAMRSGYNNLQSFYRNFSDIMEMTPKAWMSKL